MKVIMTATNPVINDPRIIKEARALNESGHDVKIIAWDRECKHVSEITEDGIEIIRIPVKAHCGIMVEFIKSLPLFYARALKLLKKMDFDVIHTHDFDTAFLGYVLKKKHKKNTNNNVIKWVYDIHDLYESYVENNPILAKIVCMLDITLMKNADELIVVNEKFNELISKRVNDKNVVKKIKIIRNTINPPKISLIKPIEKLEFKIFYGGVLSRNRYILEMMDICEELSIKMTIAGSGILENEIKERVKNSKYLTFLGVIPQNILLEEMNKHSLNFAIYDPNILNNQLATPNKLFESMCMGIPIIVTKGSVMGDIVEKNKCGLTVDFNKKSIKEAILKLKNNNEFFNESSKNALNSYFKYTWNKQVEELMKLYPID